MLTAMVANTAPHALHDPARTWPLTSCYTDLWIELLHGAGLDPYPALGFAACVEWQGDQFTFLKPHLADLDALYGLQVQELALWDAVEGHVAAQLSQGRPVLLETDAFHLPDLAGGSYRREHTKTTIAILGLDPRARQLSYVHNASRGMLEGSDYAAVFRAMPSGDGLPLLPYAEVVRRRVGPSEAELTETTLNLLRGHLARRSAPDQVAPFRDALPGQLDILCARPAGFHGWAFNTVRQFGAGAELLGDCLGWLEARRPLGLSALSAQAANLAAQAKALQFRVARLVARRRVESCADLLDALQSNEAAVVAGLHARLA